MGAGLQRLRRRRLVVKRQPHAAIVVGGDATAAAAEERYGHHAVHIGEHDGHADADDERGDEWRDEYGAERRAGHHQIALVLAHELVARVDLARRPDGQADEYEGHGDARYERDAHGRPNERAQLPHDLLLGRPGLLAPERAARGRKVVQVADLLHAEPAELAAAHAARDVVARAVVHLDDERRALGTPLDLLLDNVAVGAATRQYGRGGCGRGGSRGRRRSRADLRARALQERAHQLALLGRRACLRGRARRHASAVACRSSSSRGGSEQIAGTYEHSAV